MNLVRNTAVILVILAGVIGSYLILKNPNFGAASGGSDKISELSRQILDKNPIQWVERAREQISAATDSALGSKISSGPVNLTDLVAQQMFSGMKNIVQNGNGDPQTGFNPDDSKNQELINAAIGDIQNPLSGYDLSVDEKLIKILQDNSTQSKKQYLNAVLGIVAQNQTEAYKNPTKSVDDAVLFGNSSGLNQLIKTYQNLFIGFASLPVPVDYFELHKKYLEFMRKAEVVYLGIADAQNDPVRASLFIQMVPEIAGGEIEIYKEYYKLMTS